MNPRAPARSLKSLADPGEWHASTAQPRLRKIGITLSLKNFCPSDRLASTVDGPTVVAQASSFFHASSSLVWKNTPPVWVNPPAVGASGLSTSWEISGG